MMVTQFNTQEVHRLNLTLTLIFVPRVVTERRERLHGLERNFPTEGAQNLHYR
jgi:hypothetical protein